MSGAEPSAPDQLAGEQSLRQRWLAVLAKASLVELQAAWDSLPEKPEYRLLRGAETGLIMVRGRIGGKGQAFNLGEMTVTRACAQLVDVCGEVRSTGIGYVSGRSGRRAELVAIFDALLQDPVWQARLEETVITPLAASQREAKAGQAAKVAATKVDFFTMVRGE